MRKLAIVAMLAIVGAMIPLSAASSTPPTTGQDGGSIMAINSVTTPIDLWIEVDGTFTKYALNSTDQQQIDLPTGDHAFTTCVPNIAGGSTSQTCTGTLVTPYGTAGTIHIEKNDIVNFLIVNGASAALAGPTKVFQAENNTDKTKHDHAHLTLVNGSGAAITLCVGNDVAVSAPAGSLSLNVGEVNSKNNDTQTLGIYISPPGPAFTSCSAAPLASKELGFPEGSNTVINFTSNPNCTTDCGYQIFPGAGIGDTSSNVAAFCATLTNAQNITPWLQALFAEVQVGNPDTYPSPDKVEKVLTKIKEILDGGNEAAPSDIRGAWLTATAAFVETGRLAAVGYDISALSQDDLRNLVEGIDTPKADDENVVKAKADIGAWFVANCGGAAAVTTQPSFTG